MTAAQRRRNRPGHLHSRGMSFPEILVVCAIVGIVSMGIYRLMSFGTAAYTAGGAKLNNLQDATLLLARLKSDMRNAAPTKGADGAGSEGPPVVIDGEGRYSLYLETVDAATRKLTLVKVEYAIEGQGADRQVVRRVIDGADAGKTGTYGRGAFEEFSITPVSVPGKPTGGAAPPEVKGYRVRVCFSMPGSEAAAADTGAGAGQSPENSSRRRGTVTFDTLMFPRNAGTKGKGDNWQYFSLPEPTM